MTDILVPKNLRATVQSIWQWTPRNNLTFLNPPDVNAGFLLTLFNGTLTIDFYGPVTRMLKADLRAGAQYFGVLFQPGCLPALPDLVPGEQIDMKLNCSNFFETSQDELSEKLFASPRGRRADVLVDVLTGQAPKSILETDSLCRQVIERLQFRQQSITEIANEFAVGRRTLERGFRDQVGMAPKQLASILRFRRAWNLVKWGSRQSGANLAQALGYADQSHLCRDFVQFSGMTIRELRSSHFVANLQATLEEPT